MQQQMISHNALVHARYWRDWSQEWTQTLFGKKRKELLKSFSLSSIFIDKDLSVETAKSEGN